MKHREEKERKLTPAEQRRKEHFQVLRAGLEREGYTAHELTLNAVKANFLAVAVMLPFIVAIVFAYVWVNGVMEELSLPALALMLVALIVLLVAHELIHGLVWGSFAPSRFKSIEFGVMWTALAPYCTCSSR